MGSVHSKSAGALAETVRTLRERAGLTQKELGAAIGYDDSWVSRLETGAGGCQASDLPKLAKELKTTLPKLVKLWMALLQA